MAERLKVKSGTKVQLACDVQTGGEPEFNLISTFYKALDDSAFLISVPMQGGKPMELDESLRLLLRFGSGYFPVEGVVLLLDRIDLTVERFFLLLQAAFLLLQLGAARLLFPLILGAGLVYFFLCLYESFSFFALCTFN